jgi:hypothetical protein
MEINSTGREQSDINSWPEKQIPASRSDLVHENCREVSVMRPETHHRLYHDGTD